MADINSFEEQISEPSLLSDFSYMMEESVVVKNETLTPTSQKKNKDAKRWASVVKCQKTNVCSPDSSTSAKSCKKLTYKTASDLIINDSSQEFLEDYENHKGFIAISACKTYISCKICSLELNSIPNLTNHLKTRKHEDNIIQFLKSHIPVPHLHHTMEFISFSGSKLCCNLCKKEVHMSSENPQETILNIIAHNTDIVHSSEKYNHPYSFTHAHNIIRTLAETQCEIKNNINFIDKKMMPQFKCTLCDKNIFFTDDLEKLAQNFANHLLSNGHTKNRKSVQILQQYSESRTNEKECFIFKLGNIFCTCCEMEVEADLEKLKSHEDGFEHSKNKFMKKEHLDYAQMVKKSKFENQSNEEKLACFKEVQKNKTFGLKSEKKEESGLVGEVINSKLKDLFDTLQNVPSYLKNMNHFKINEQNSMTCIICEKIVPPSSYNIKTHLLGNNHNRNLVLKNVNQNTTENEECVIKTGNIRNTEGVVTVEDIRLASSEYLKQSANSKSDKPNVQHAACKMFLDGQKLNVEQIKCQNHEFKGCSKCSYGYHVQFENIPKSLRVEKCRKPTTLPLRLVKKKFDDLVKKSSIIRVNKDLIDINLDGINSYCKLCKVLIPLTIKGDVFETALSSHLQKKSHLEKLSEFYEYSSENSKKSFSPRKSTRSSSLKLSCSSPKVRKNPSKRSFTITPQLSTNLVSSASKIDDCANFWKVEDSKSEALPSVEEFKPKPHSEEKEPIFVFGKENIPTEESTEENPDSKSPVKCSKPNPPLIKSLRSFKIESENDEETLKRREKQIEYGKCTDGYRHYVERVPLLKRQPKHPFTPPKYMKCSRRTWDGLIKVWRRHLHSWDPDSETKTATSSTLDADIRPLS